MTDPDPAPSPPAVAATFCATLVDEWVRGGVTHVVIAPGSRSTPLALALAADGRVEVQVHHDERSAGFMALGIGLAGGLAVVVTTSGTAAVELHPAVVEAHQAGVALIACTADRPPELHDVGAPQTVDQTHLFGRSPRWFHQPGVPDWEARASWRSLASRSVEEARSQRGATPGPVHLDLAFREPLVGSPVALPPGRPGGAPWHRPVTAAPNDDGPAVAQLAELLDDAAGRGVIVAGAGTSAPEAEQLGSTLGWPVLADARCGLASAFGRSTPRGDLVVVHGFDPVLRTAFAADHRPHTVLWLGGRPASKVLGQWVSAAGAHEISAPGHGRWVDPDHGVQHRWASGPGSGLQPLLSAALRTSARDPGWQRAWASAAAVADAAVDEVLSAHPEATEPGVARSLTRTVGLHGARGSGVDLVVSSSMPIRDVEWFGAFDADLDVLANRGANGIDGVVSTAVGVAVRNRQVGEGRRTALLIGDIATLHDANGLLGLIARQLDLVIVVVDNDGGGIFSFLPQRATLDRDRFELLFGTPHGVDPGRLAAVHGVAVERPTSSADIDVAMATALEAGGTRMIVVRTEREANVAVHDELNAAVAHGLGGMGSAG